MALTGLFLITFLVVHVGVNACIFKDAFDSTDNGDMFNRAAQFMARNVVIRYSWKSYYSRILHSYYTRACC
jgi:succinate dehydrogenase / fumarate reductase cytochrome b subunit